MTKTEAAQVEIGVAADRLWNALWDSGKLGPKLLPEVLVSVEWIEGSGEVGSIRELKFRADALVAPIVIGSCREVIDSVDKDNYHYTYHISEGPLRELYSFYGVTIQLLPISADRTLLKHIIEFEAKGDRNPPVAHTEAYLGLCKALEAYLRANDSLYAN